MPILELPGLVVDNVAAVVAPSALALVNRDPCPGETGVPIDSTVGLELVDTASDGVDRVATRVFVGGVLAFDGSLVPEVRPGFDGSRASVAETADTLRLVLDPTTPFVSQAVVTVRVVSTLVGGAADLDEVYSFGIEDRTAPRLVAAQATAQKIVQVGFDEPVVASSVAAFTFQPLDFPAVPIAIIGAESLGSVVRVDLDTEMTPDVRYRVTAAGVTDVHGNPVEPPFDQAVFVGFRPARPQGRRFDLWSMLPKHNRRTDATGDLRRFIACLQEALDLLLAEADRFPDLFDLERAPEPFLDAILADLGNPFPFDLDALGKRRLASVLVEMYRQKGTAGGIRNAIRFFLGIDVEAITPFTGTTLVLGESELGVDWELGPSDRFARYAFDVTVGIPLADAERQQLRAIVDYMRPAHTHFVDLIEPGPPPTFEHWELGVSELGETTDLH
jgi:phage tail-like protein